MLMEMRCSREPRKIKYVKGYGFLSSTRNFGDKYGKKINGYCNKNRKKMLQKLHLK